MRASLFLGELWKDALIQNRNRMQCRSLDALSFRATLGVLALRAALLTSQWLPQIESISCSVRTELCSWQSLLASLASDRSCSCFIGSLRVPCHITTEPFLWRLRAALLALDAPVLVCVPKACLSADLSRGVLECSKLEGLPSLNGFVLRPPRTRCVSSCKTRHSRAEVLISGTLRGGGGRRRGAPNYSSEKQILFAFA